MHLAAAGSLALAFGSATAFAPVGPVLPRTDPRQKANGRPSRKRRTSGMGMLALDGAAAIADAATAAISAPGGLGDLPFLGESSFLGVPHTAVRGGGSAAAAARTLADNPSLESEVLTDASHVALDIISFAGPARASVRLSVVVGRICALLADWVPDHYMHPEEIAFQLTMLAVSFYLLAQTCAPMMPALLASTTYRDRRAFQTLFRPFGLTWMQFKMVSALASEWVEVPAHGLIEHSAGEHVHWVHRGEAELIVGSGSGSGSAPSAALRHVVGGLEKKEGKNGLGMLGDLAFAQKLQDRTKKDKKKEKKKEKKKDKKKEDGRKGTAAAAAAAAAKPSAAPAPASSPAVAPPAGSKIRAGPKGATLLRLDASRLLKLMDDDAQLSEGIRSIIFAGMQDRLLSVMEEASASMPEPEPAHSAAGDEDDLRPF